jgi:hypothetical protein
MSEVCARLLPYRVHEMHSASGRRCGRPAVDHGGPKGQEARCAVHRGVDKRTETNRAIRERRERILRRAGL